MLDHTQVKNAFALFSDLNGEELERWASLCRQAALRIERRLRPGLLEQGIDCVDMERLCYAAGAGAYQDYCVATLTAQSPGDFKVGDVWIKEKGKDKAREGRDVMEYFMAQVSDLLLPEQAPLLAVEG